MLSFSWSSRMNMKMRNNQVQRGVIFSKWSSGGVATINLQVGDCWVWSLIIFYIQRYCHIGPQFEMGAATPPVKYSLQGGSRGVAATFGSPPSAGDFGGSVLEAKNNYKIAL